MARPVDLAAEWSDATAAVRGKHLVDLTTRYGIPMTTIMEYVGVCRVRIEGGNYAPDDDGIEMVIVPCFSLPPRLPDGRWRAANEIIDLIAFDPSEPDRRWSRCGIAAALGEEMLNSFDDSPVTVVGNPLAWLRTGAAAVSPVSPDPAAVRDVFIRLPGIVVEEEDADLGRQIRLLLDQHWNKLPPIYVIRRTRGAA